MLSSINNYASELTDGQWQAYATVVGALLASSVAGLVAWRIGKRQVSILKEQTDIQLKQSAIQESLVKIEETKIKMDLMERRSDLIDATLNIMAASKIDIYSINKDVLFETIKRLDRSYHTNRFSFSNKANDCLAEIAHILSLFSTLNVLIMEPHLNTEEIDNIVTKIEKVNGNLDKMIFNQLVPETYIFEQNL